MISDDILWHLIHLYFLKTPLSAAIHDYWIYMHFELTSPLTTSEYIWWYDAWATCLISFIISISVAPASPDEAVSTDASGATGLIAPGVVREPKYYMLHTTQNILHILHFSAWSCKFFPRSRYHSDFPKCRSKAAHGIPIPKGSHSLVSLELY